MVLKAVQAKVSKLLKQNLPLYIVFVTLPNGISSARPLGKKAHVADKNHLQFLTKGNDLNLVLKDSSPRVKQFYMEHDDEKFDQEGEESEEEIESDDELL